LLDSDCKAFVVYEAAEFAREDYETISLIPLTTEVAGVTTVGLKYPLQNEILSVGTTRGISNEFAADTVGITISDGLLLIICTKTA